VRAIVQLPVPEFMGRQEGLFGARHVVAHQDLAEAAIEERVCIAERVIVWRRGADLEVSRAFGGDRRDDVARAKAGVRQAGECRTPQGDRCFTGSAEWCHDCGSLSASALSRSLSLSLTPARW